MKQEFRPWAVLLGTMVLCRFPRCDVPRPQEQVFVSSTPICLLFLKLFLSMLFPDPNCFSGQSLRCFAQVIFLTVESF